MARKRSYNELKRINEYLNSRTVHGGAGGDFSKEMRKRVFSLVTARANQLPSVNATNYEASKNKKIDINNFIAKEGVKQMRNQKRWLKEGYIDEAVDSPIIRMYKERVASGKINPKSIVAG